MMHSVLAAALRAPRFAFLAALGLAAAPAAAQTVYGLSGLSSVPTALVTFQAATPGTFTTNVTITGVTAGQTLVGLDVRPNTGELFALGYNASTQQGQLYRLNPTTGAATSVGAAVALALGGATERIGFDFNPTVDRIRVTSTNRANYRLNPNNGAVAATDGQLTYATTDANAAQTPGVGASAYTNSYIGTGTTTLYNVDEINSRLVTQSPPNDGTLNTVGALGITTSSPGNTADLDIAYDVTARTNTAYLTVSNIGTTANSTSLYTVNLSTGAATLVGMVGPMNSTVTDIAVAINRTVPATLTGRLMVALSGTNLLTFDSALPGTIRTLVPVTGVATGQTLVGTDFRPATNELFALGYNATNQQAQLYRLDLATGAATAVGTTPLTLALGATTDHVGFDFNPTVDRIRVTSTNRANYRLNPNDGALAATDGTLTYATTDANANATPAIGASAYTNNLAPAPTSTVLYNYDEALNVLVRQDPPNNGTLNTVGSSGIVVNRTTNAVDFDIYTSGTTDVAVLAAGTGTSTTDNLYTVNLTTGAATLVGAIGGGVSVSGLAAYPQAGLPTAALPKALAAQIAVYPNPAQGEALLQVPAELTRQPLTVRLLNALGQPVWQRELAGGAAAAPTRLSLQGLAAGVYLVQLSTAQGHATKRLLVQ